MHDNKLARLVVGALAATALTACVHTSTTPETTETQSTYTFDHTKQSRLNIYKPVVLTSSTEGLTTQQHQVLHYIMEAAEVMDDLFWLQAYPGDKAALLKGITDKDVRHFADMNYGPWDRLANDEPFLTEFGKKPLGAGFYPADMTKEEFEAFDDPNKDSEYTVLRRDEQGQLYTIAYSDYYADGLQKASDLLLQAAQVTENESLAYYLRLRAEALLSNEYEASEYAWLAVQDNAIDLIIGPVETYEDLLFGYKTSFEAYVLLKDIEWSERLAVYAQTLPALQRGLPVPAEYKAEEPGTDGQLNAYDVVYYAGHSNAGSKTIAVNLPNSEAVQLQAGTRRLQLKNAMRAKFDEIMIPIADVLIVPEQRQHITFDAFFANTMFHEVAHGLGIKNTLDGQGTVRAALKEYASPIEEGKADILGLYMVTQLLEEGIITEGVLEDYYVTFLAGIFRSVRFGASSAHGKANMIRFNYFEEHKAFVRQDNGLYAVHLANMRRAVDGLSELILRLQGDGDYTQTAQLFEDKGHIGFTLQADLDRLEQANIPVDVYFIQGKEQLGLK